MRNKESELPQHISAHTEYMHIVHNMNLPKLERWNILVANIDEKGKREKL
jgi:hypothetical protein